MRLLGICKQLMLQQPIQHYPDVSIMVGQKLLLTIPLGTDDHIIDVGIAALYIPQ